MHSLYKNILPQVLAWFGRESEFAEHSSVPCSAIRNSIAASTSPFTCSRIWDKEGILWIYGKLLNFVEKTATSKRSGLTEICHATQANNINKACIHFTCSTFSAFSHPVPAITNFMDPGWKASQPARPWNLLPTTFVWCDGTERSASAFHKLELIRQ